MRTFKVFVIVLAVILVSFAFSSVKADSSENNFKSFVLKSADTSDGGIKNPGAGDNPYPTIKIPGK